MKSLVSKFLSTAALLSLAVTVPAATMTLGTGLDRQATLTDAQAGGAGEGNTSGAALTGYFGDTWKIEGDTNSTNGLTNGFLTVTLTGGTWGGQPVITGTWSIASGFFDKYADAVISLHVGNGQGTPDHFAWLISDNVTSGTWSYDANTGRGGGLSNIQLWGSGTPTTKVPDHATTAILLGVALIGLSFATRRRSA